MGEDDSDDSSQEEEDLENRICNLLATSKFDAREQHFLPDNCINDLITKDTIMKELELDDDPEHITEDQRRLVEWIQSDAKKVFAITVQCSIGVNNMLASMLKFQKHKFNNECLPVDNLSRQSRENLPAHFRSNRWTSKRLHSFWEHQWKCLTPVFSMDMYNYNLSSECIFPFTWKDETFKEGAFSCVYKVKIHEAHQKHEFNEVRVPWPS
jgi:hypothetical protein